MVKQIRYALKEWSVVIRALTQGRQLLLLRKGGVEEEDGKFQVEHREFVFYPTFEHQHRKYLRAAFLPDFDAAVAGESPNSPEIVLTGFAQVTAVMVAPDFEKLLRLSSFHVWNDAFIEMRYHYKPEKPLYLLLMRVHLMQPVRIAYRPEYRGCKSWVGLETDVETRNLQPVLENDEFERQCSKVRELLT